MEFKNDLWYAHAHKPLMLYLLWVTRNYYSNAREKVGNGTNAPANCTIFT